MNATTASLRWPSSHPSCILRIDPERLVPDPIRELTDRARDALARRRPGDALLSLQELVPLLRARGDRRALARALRELAELERGREPEEARLHYEESVALLRDLGQPLELAHTIRHLGDVHREAGHAERARACYDEALVLYAHHGQQAPLDMANAIRSAAILAADRGDIAGAQLLWRRAHDLYLETGVDAGIAEAAGSLALLAHRAGEPARAIRWLQGATRAATRARDAATDAFVREVREHIG